MGRTNPTFRDHLRRFEEQWQPFRRGLRKPHQEHFDALLEYADGFAQASGMQNPAHAYRAILLSMVLALEVERSAQAARIGELEDQVDELEAALDDAV